MHALKVQPPNWTISLHAHRVISSMSHIYMQHILEKRRKERKGNLTRTILHQSWKDTRRSRGKQNAFWKTQSWSDWSRVRFQSVSLWNSLGSIVRNKLCTKNCWMSNFTPWSLDLTAVLSPALWLCRSLFTGTSGYALTAADWGADNYWTAFNWSNPDLLFQRYLTKKIPCPSLQ